MAKESRRKKEKRMKIKLEQVSFRFRPRLAPIERLDTSGMQEKRPGD